MLPATPLKVDPAAKATRPARASVAGRARAATRLSTKATTMTTTA